MNSDFSDLLQCLNSCQAEYLVVGGYAVIAYAEPRFTKDLDVWFVPRLRTQSEALIKNKLASGRPQDIVDAENVRRSSD